MLPARRGLALRCCLPHAARFVAAGTAPVAAVLRRPIRHNARRASPHQSTWHRFLQWLRLPSCRLLVHHSKEGQMNRMMTLGVGCLVLVGAGCADDAASPTRPNLLTASQPSPTRSEEHTSELQSRYVISYAVFCL